MTSLTGSPRIPALVTGGRRKASQATSESKPDDARGHARLWRSLSTKIALLFVVFAALPAIVYHEMRLVDGGSIYVLAIAYAAASGLLLWVLLGLLLSLRRLDVAARSLGSGVRLGEANRLPELGGVVREFDRMAQSLHLAAETSRIAAVENAHAFKTPIATITHALTPLRNAVPPDNARARRSIELIQMTLARLDALVMASRRMEEAFAKALHPPLDRIEIAAIIRHRVAARESGVDGARQKQAGALRFQAEPGGEIIVEGNADLICTAIDNVLDNAVSFTKPGGSVVVGLRRDGSQAVCCIDDEGPGARVEDLERIFERYYTYRPAPADAIEPGEFETGDFGIGLWVARRNIEALGGKIWAEVRPGGGMRIVMTLPMAGNGVAPPFFGSGGR